LIPPASIISTDRLDTADRPDTTDRRSRRIAVLGATGSIGLATIEVIEHLRRTDSDCEWHLNAASGHRRIDLLREISNRFEPSLQIVVSDPVAHELLTPSEQARFSVGPEALVRLATDPAIDTVVAAVVGSAGLESTLAAARCGKRIALANKEALVVAGPLIQSAVESSGAELLPIDSEHSAIFQSLGASGTCRQAAKAAKKLILTASGGPFRTWTTAQMQQATPAQAKNHPTWDMGEKITIDSATMMNKALEIIEARWLFDVPAEAIEVMIHPQSIIHSMIECHDGSVIAQLSPPDMKLPIQLALTHPRRLPAITPTLDRSRNYDLRLEVADRDRFPALNLGFEVARIGGSGGAVVNAANEQAVSLFLAGKIRFTEIVTHCQRALDHHEFDPNPTLERLLQLDAWARDEVRRMAVA
jgi:1-deoxy-D-xylulose-5-phosphate reductoisomerase